MLFVPCETQKHIITTDSDTVLTYHVPSVQLKTDKKLEALNNA